MVESDGNVGYVRNPTGSDYQGTKPGSLRLKAKKRNGSVLIDVGKSAYHYLSQMRRYPLMLSESANFRGIPLCSVGVYDVACASFATRSRTSPLSRAFSFVNWRPRLSISRRSLRDRFFPSRSSPLIFFGASLPS